VSVARFLRRSRHGLRWQCVNVINKDGYDGFYCTSDQSNYHFAHYRRTFAADKLSKWMYLVANVTVSTNVFNFVLQVKGPTLLLLRCMRELVAKTAQHGERLCIHRCLYNYVVGSGIPIVVHYYRFVLCTIYPYLSNSHALTDSSLQHKLLVDQLQVCLY